MLLCLILLCACTNPQPVGTWSGPLTRASTITEAWTFAGQPARIIRTQHYRLHTTMTDETPAQVAQVLEGAFAEYRRLTPHVIPNARPMDVYLFLHRDEWANFTRANTGAYAQVYLRVQRGGYTLNDVAVTHYLGDIATWHVMAHEGWHQFVSRNFTGRLPPFLEEGIACLFESVQYDTDLPQWNLSINPNRAVKLREAIEEHAILPLDQLIRLHAGELVGQSPSQIDAFYAQNWAFARFLREAQGGRFKPALEQILADTAAGTVYDPTGTLGNKDAPWNPDCVKPMLEHYLQMPLDQVDAAYQTYLHYLAEEEYRAQWRS